MSGIYIHIPYCHKACNYCDFHFSTILHDVDKMIDAICIELVRKKEYLNTPNISTIYFGGGTPSILNKLQLDKIFVALHRTYNVPEGIEITLEANPEDINTTMLETWSSVGINRLSIGIQSFQDTSLTWMNRNHSAEEAIQAVKRTQAHGISNISIDLIYGLPKLSTDLWRSEIKKAIDLNVSHISTYCLTIEDKTVFGNMLKKGKLPVVSDEIAEAHMLILMEEMELNGFEQYEISNFCKPNYESQHNSSYWKGTSYIGIGPGAHSYNQISRQHNISNNALYIKQMFDADVESLETIETLSAKDQYNEYVLTRLRTKWGIQLSEIERLASHEYNTIQQQFVSLSHNKLLILENQTYRLTKKGKLLADEITLQLML
jgi:oxygen-independent coproporphyrinogen III oxidase